MANAIPSHVTPRVWISQLTFSDGTTISFSPSDVVVIVGPNNVGKSEALRAINGKLKSPAHFSPVIKTIGITRTGEVTDLITWLDEWVSKKLTNPADPIYQAQGVGVPSSRVKHDWQRTDQSLDQLTRWFCHLLSADERLQLCNPANNIALADDNPVHPIHFLQRDDTVEKNISAIFRKAFGMDLIVHRNAGSSVPLYVGEKPLLVGSEDRVSRSYILRLEKLPTLHAQGDGMRSFAGVVLATSVGRESMILIDEPEAFLHPPQAHYLGSMLVSDRLEKRQLFISTHSGDVVRGMLEPEIEDVRVIRIKRTGDINTVHLLNNIRIKELWSDPLLRNSNILDGLFHESVIVCEAESDSRFYAAILDALLSNKGEDIRRPDIMFTQCGGKDRLAVVVKALREVDVPVHVVADFDIFSEEYPLHSLIDSIGLDWKIIEPDWKKIKAAVDSKKPELNSDEVKKEIIATLDAVTEQAFPPTAGQNIKNVLKKSSAWAHAKSSGKAFLPSGEAYQTCERLLATLQKAGLHIVEIGELECFVKTEAGHGAKWVNAVLKRALATDPELEAARKFVTRFIV